MLSVLIVVESCAFLLPAGGPADNPFYVFQEGGIVAGNDKLQFVRPPYLKWKGTSRGDLAMLADVHDPYATTVSFETDFEGFRNERDIRVADVVFLGDSFTEAGNVPAEETFVWRSSSELNVRARNLGRAAYGPTAELIVLKTYGVSCQPRLVVWQFCESNDLNEDVEFRRWVDAGRPQLQPVVDSTRAAIWRRRSPAYLLFQRLKEPRPWPLRGLFRDSHGENHPLLFLKLPDRSNSPAGHIGWPLMAETLQEGVELLRRNEVELLVLFIPQKIRVMGPYVEFNATIRDRMSQNWDLPPEQTLAKYLRDLCLRIHVSFVDATPRLKDAAAAGQLVYLPMDTHLSPQGHAIVSSLITESIRERFENHEPAQRD